MVKRRLRLIVTAMIAVSLMVLSGPATAQTDIPVDVTVTPATGVDPGDELVVRRSDGHELRSAEPAERSVHADR